MITFYTILVLHLLLGYIGNYQCILATVGLPYIHNSKYSDAIKGIGFSNNLNI